MISIPVEAVRCDLGENDWYRLRALLQSTETVVGNAFGFEVRVSPLIPEGWMIWKDALGKIVGMWKLEEESQCLKSGSTL